VTDNAAVPPALPDRCLTRDPSTGKTVIVMRGRVGFIEYAGSETPDTYNQRHGLTYEQIEAMEYGCRLGFDNPLADPDAVRSVREELGLPTGLIERIGSAPRRVLHAEPDASRACDAGPAGATLRETFGAERDALPNGLEFLPEFIARRGDD